MLIVEIKEEDNSSDWFVKIYSDNNISCCNCQKVLIDISIKCNSCEKVNEK
jgi:hypothetical protein